MKNQKNQFFLTILFISNLILISGLNAKNPTPKTTEYSYIPTVISPDTEIGNPQRGFYQWNNYPYINSIPRYDFYKRFSWRLLETSNNVYDFSRIEECLKTLKKGERFSFRVMALNTCCSSFQDGAEVPEYVIKEKLGWFYAHRYAGSDSIFIPDWNNKELLNRMEKLVQALGKRYDNDPRISWVETGLYGNWGEGHNYPIMYADATGPYDKVGKNSIIAPVMKDPTDTTIYKYRNGTIESKLRILNAHINAFPHKQLIALTTDLPLLSEALKIKTEIPLGFRRDSWGGKDFVDITLWKTYKPSPQDWELLNNRWKTAPFLAENWGGKYTTDSDMVKQLEHYKTSAIAFGNFGVKKFEDLSQQQQENYLRCARQTGYRYQITKVDAKVRNSSIDMTTAWRNINMAPTYEGWIIEAYVTNSQGDLFSNRVSIPVNLKLLLNNSTAPIQNNISVTLNQGWKAQKQLEMRIVVKHPDGYLLPLNLDMTDRNEDGSYKLFSAEISNGKLFLLK